MQADSTEQYSLNMTSGFVEINSTALEGHPQEERGHSEHEPTSFHGSFASCMEMYSDAATVARYLDEHHAWFPRCAQPMTTESIGQNGYALTIGRFGSFGYEVEPKIGLDLLPQDQGVYRIQTIPIPGYVPPGYDVDFQAALQLVEVATDETVQALFERTKTSQMPDRMTRVEWELDLKVMIQFPRFIQALPKSLIQNTGDQLLNKIVREVSRRLTHKVQEDFHTTMGVPFPKKQRKWL